MVTHSNLVPYQFGFIQSNATQPILMAAQALRSFQDDSMSTRRILALFYIKKKKKCQGIVGSTVIQATLGFFILILKKVNTTFITLIPKMAL